ncbi:hypothetical protein ABPG72_013506 [Tetrahymena utriculariae]
MHLNINPQNILVTESGNYFYTDFGISSIKKENEQAQIKGLTNLYASPEQKADESNIDFQSNIYSLGKTFQIVLDRFKAIQKSNYSDFIAKLNDLVKFKMLQNESNNRSNCIELSKEFF